MLETFSEMLSGLIWYALLAGLATALAIAAVTDLRRREIDNGLNSAIALCAPLFWLTSGLDGMAVLSQLALALVTFIAACALFAIRQMGGGDVKLLSALALWFVPGSFLQLIVLMGVIGGGASMAIAVYNMHRQPGEALRDVVSTVVAALWVLGACALLYVAATGRALVDPNTLQAFATMLPSGWLLAAIGIALLVMFAMGLSHIFRRQRGEVPIPYGVAIAAAGLWIIGEYVTSEQLRPLI